MIVFIGEQKTYGQAKGRKPLDSFALADTVLAEQGTYTAAAARLGVSKAAMSQRIAELDFP
jgi:hypothetical protein